MWLFELPLGNLKRFPLFEVLGVYWFGAAVPKTRSERRLCPNTRRSTIIMAFTQIAEQKFPNDLSAHRFHVGRATPH